LLFPFELLPADNRPVVLRFLTLARFAVLRVVLVKWLPLLNVTSGCIMAKTERRRANHWLQIMCREQVAHEKANASCCAARTFDKDDSPPPLLSVRQRGITRRDH